MMCSLLRCIANNPGQSSLELFECLAGSGYEVDRGLLEIAIMELERRKVITESSSRQTDLENVESALCFL